MKLAVTIFSITFIVILIINQMFYGGCFKAHCLSAALPKVVIISTFVSWFLYSVKKTI
jgi:tryptophan-rich sensory protein